MTHGCFSRAGAHVAATRLGTWDSAQVVRGTAGTGATCSAEGGLAARPSAPAHLSHSAGAHHRGYSKGAIRAALGGAADPDRTLSCKTWCA
eukprot:10617326-Alexandrium_andersonii.AAC.1